MQDWQKIIITVVFALFISSNAIFVANYAGEYDLIYVNILKSRYVKRLNIIGKIIVLIVLFPFTIFTLGFYVMSNLAYWIWLGFSLMFSKDRKAVIQENKKHMRDTSWHNRLSMM